MADTQSMPVPLDTATLIQPEPEAFIRYPPFPAPPPGVTIIPFSLFRPSGIPIALDPTTAPDPELDARGIGTVRLRVEHVPVDDNERAKKKRKKKKGPGGVSIAAPQAPGDVKRPWWEMWRIQEEAKGYNVPFDRDANGFQRLEQATAHFADMRDWPSLTSEVHKVWSALKEFIGVFDPRAGQQPKPPVGENEAPFDATSDDEDFGITESPGHAQEMPMLDSGIAELSDEPTLLELKMSAFMESPERAVKIFLSSFFREKGLVWNELRCRDGPRLVTFFVNFLARSRAFITPHDIQQRLEKAAAISAQALIELPGSFTMGKVLPGNVNEACLNAWGTRCATFDNFDFPLSTPPEEPTQAPEEEEFKQQLKEANMEVIDAAQAYKEGEYIEAIKDNLDLPPGDQLATDGIGQWGSTVNDSTTSGWGTGANSGEGWGNLNNPSAGRDAWDTGTSELANWTVHYISFLELLGPTAFPNTHTPGVVERSTRRIIAVLPPDDGPHVPGLQGAGAVEDVLARRFARLKMAPWGTIRESSDMNRPEITNKSHGPVVVRDAKGKRSIEGAVDGIKPHDPLKDTITVLIDVEAVPTILLNMGLGATWIQIVRTNEAKEDAEPKEPTTTFWYMEQLSQLMPSYYTDP